MVNSGNDSVDILVYRKNVIVSVVVVCCRRETIERIWQFLAWEERGLGLNSFVVQFPCSASNTSETRRRR